MKQLMPALIALQSSLGAVPSPAFGVISPGSPHHLWAVPCWLGGIVTGLLSKHLKLAFVHLFNGSPPHVTLVRKRLH